MKAAHVCVACSGSVSMELLYHRKPTVIVYKVQRWAILAQAIYLRTKFITLVNLIAVTDIRKKSLRPYNPDATDADPCVMPEYLTSGDPSEQVARRIIDWLTDDDLYDRKVAELDSLATQYAIPGATERAADYILNELRLEFENSDSSTESRPDNFQNRSNKHSAA
jgi:lipid-A-disaccharide synthase